MTEQETDKTARWGEGQVVQRRRTSYYYHVVNRYRDVDDGHVLYRLASPTHTGYEYIREADAIHEYEGAGFRLPTSIKPASVFGQRVEGILYGYNERPHEPVTDGGQMEDPYSGWVCDSCGKHVTGSMPVDQCSDCGGRWFEATPERLACDRCGAQDASSVLNPEYNRLCDDCVKWENVILDAYEFDKGDVFQGMDGHFWVVTERLWNHDAVEYERSSPTGQKYETTMPWHRREYVLSKLDPAAMGCDTQRVNESDLTHHFSESSKEKAQTHYEAITESDDDGV